MVSRRDLLVRSAGLGVLSRWAHCARPVAASGSGGRAPTRLADPGRGRADRRQRRVEHGRPVCQRHLSQEPADTADRAAQVLKLDDRVGLHFALKEMHQVWESGDLAVVQGIGYPNPNRSHTRSMEIWQTGVLGPAPPAGWLGRAADASSSLALCHVSSQPLPLALRGAGPFPRSCPAWTTTGSRRVPRSQNLPAEPESMIRF